MFKRPSSRSRAKHEEIILNLVPILDTMVTLIAFLLFTMSFMAVVSIESPFPQTGPAIVREKLKERPLQLTLSIRENEVEVWSPFQRVETRRIAHSEPGKPDTKAVHEAMLAIKQRFPGETKIVFAPHPSVNYDQLISLMDSVRYPEATDPPIYARNEQTGNDELVKTLFPDVVFGNLLGGG